MILEKQVELVKEFVAEVKSRYPSIIIDYDYDEEADLFDIWHNDKSLQFENEEFLTNVGTLIKKILYKNSFFNFSFGYDYYRAKAVNSASYTLQKDPILEALTIKFNYSSFNPELSFSANKNTSKGVDANPAISFHTITEGKTFKFTNTVVSPMFRVTGLKNTYLEERLAS